MTQLLDDARFDLGKVVSTPAALRVLLAHTVLPSELLCRHLRGDWGDICASDARLNEDALTNGARLLSSYAIGDQRIWIITEADRSVTTMLLPEEY